MRNLLWRSGCRAARTQLAWLGLLAWALAPAGAEEGDAWPPNGPVREGRTLVFPTIGVRWTLPDGSPFVWSSPTPDEKKARGVMVRAVVPANPGESTVMLRVDPADQPLRVDMDLPANWVASVGEGLLGVDPKRTELKHPAPMGNASCHYVRKVGTWKGKPAAYRGWLGYRHGRIIAVEAWRADPLPGETSLDAALTALVATLAFDDRKPWVIGPALVIGTNASDHRDAADADKTVDVPLPGRTFPKPIGLSSVPYDASRAPEGFRGAWEAWTPDRTAYFCFILEALRSDGLSGDYPQMILRQHEKAWKQNLADAEIVTKGKQVGPKVAFGKLKGVGSEFRGRFCGVPYLQRGVYGEQKGIVYLLQFQYGGEGAEAQFEELREKVRLALGF